MPTADAIVEVVKALGPVATGVGGALATLWRTTHRIFARLKKLEAGVDSLQVSVTRTDNQVQSHDNQIRTLDAGVAEHERTLVSLRAALPTLVTQTSLAKVLERLASAERRMAELEEENDRLERTLVNFAREQNEQWQGINRSLGQLEGYIKGRTLIHDS